MKTNEQHITQKALELFHKYGIRGITMDELAREMGISKKTIYHHILDKEALVHQCIEHEMNRLKARLDPHSLAAENAVEHFLGITRTMATIATRRSILVEHDLKKYYPNMASQMHQTVYKLVSETLKENLRQGKRQGLYRSEIDESFVVRLALLHQKIFEEEKEAQQDTSPMKTLFQYMDYHIRGIATPKGIELLNEITSKTKNQKSIIE